MAIIDFNGSASRTVAFTEEDTLNLNVPNAQIRNVVEGTNGVTITLVSGISLTLTGVDYGDLAAADVNLLDGGDFTVLTGSGDVANAGDAGDVVLGGVGANTILLGDGDNLVFGGGTLAAPTDGNDVIVTGSGDDTVYGNGGNDVIRSIGGNDLLAGGSGSDAIAAAPGDGETATIFGGGGVSDPTDGDDFIFVGNGTAPAEGDALVYGNGGDDVIVVNSLGDNTIYGGTGSDLVLVGNGDSTGDNLVYGGPNDPAGSPGDDLANGTGLIRIAVALGLDITAIGGSIDAIRGALLGADIDILADLDLGIAGTDIVDLTAAVDIDLELLDGALADLDAAALANLGLIEVDGALVQILNALPTDLAGLQSFYGTLPLGQQIALANALATQLNVNVVDLLSQPIGDLLNGLLELDADVLLAAGLAVSNGALQQVDGLATDADVTAFLDQLDPAELTQLLDLLDLGQVGDDVFPVLDDAGLLDVLLGLDVTVLADLGLGVFDGQLVALDLLAGLDVGDLLSSLGFDVTATLAFGLTIGDILEGGDLPDVLRGLDVLVVESDGDNTVFGGTGVDDPSDGSDLILVAGEGDNLIYGNGGDDFIAVGGSGRNTVYGGAGDDVISVTPLEGDGGVPATLAAAPGEFAGDVLLAGGSGDDAIFAVVDGDLLIYGGSAIGDPTDGSDEIGFEATGDVLVYGNGGDDDIEGEANRTTIYAGLGDDLVDVFGEEEAFVVGGSGEDDLFVGTFGNATVYGGNGVSDPTDDGDVIGVAASGSALVYGNGGDDDIAVDAERATVYGGVGNDTIEVGDVFGLDISLISGLVVGGDGADDIEVFGGGDVTVYGGNGEVDPTADNDVIGVDVGGQAVVYGNGGNDDIDVQAGSASIYGGLGDDTITLVTSDENGSSYVRGGPGADTIEVYANGDVTVFGGDIVLDPTDGADDVYVELRGAGDAVIYGNGGNDRIELAFDSEGSAGGGSSIFGGFGDDRIIVSGEYDDRTVSVFGSQDADTIDLTQFTGRATVFGGISAIDPGDGADRILLGGGDALVYGNGGNDTIVSGGGDTTMIGGVGADLLVGGEGDDTFVFSAGSSGLSAGTLDRVETFDLGSDLLDFGLAAGSATTFASATSSSANYEAALTAANTAFVAAEGPTLYSFQTVGSDGYLFVDADANGSADSAILLAGVTTLTADAIV